MYSDVYECMVECGVATKLNEYSFEYPGDLKTKYHLKHPEMCLVVDEVGCNISQRGDGHVRGTKFCCEIGSIPQNKASHNDRHFTCLGFTALSGEPVLCVVIIAGINDSYEVEVGIDTDAPIIGDPSDSNYLEINRGVGKLFPCGPECKFNGKTIPALVRWSPTGSITSEILRDCLATLDHHEIFDRKDSKKPFLLLDGHGSRFELAFLEYVTNKAHPWMVCQGVPYGTSLWQVADSSEQNGSFKSALSHIKMQILKKRLDMMMDNPCIVATDIIPIVSYAWRESFANVNTNQKAIADRGWNPLNYNLLTSKQIIPTMTESESMELQSMMKSHPINSTQQSSTVSVTNGNGSSTNTMMLSIHTTSLSDLTDDGLEMNYDPQFIKPIPSTVVSLKDKLNFKTGRSAHVARALLHESDILEAREQNQKSAIKGKEAKEKLDKAKKLTAMLNFRSFGCKIGEDSLQARLKMAKNKSMEEAKIVQKKNDKIMKRKLQFDELQTKIRSENLPLEKLSLAQLKILCMYKKKDSDRISISKLKRSELLALWLEWRHRHDVVDVNGIAVNPPLANNCDDGTGTGTGKTIMIVDDDNVDDISDEDMNMIIV